MYGETTVTVRLRRGCDSVAVRIRYVYVTNAWAYTCSNAYANACTNTCINAYANANSNQRQRKRQCQHQKVTERLRYGYGTTKIRLRYGCYYTE
ncbi:hypothetical protein EVAR_2749_1 [Eumeta japonica]|uniref:Uncharacterized protein n=1 Tax=Eumeta variegata TaxID=151549 RepID=A0A4C1T2D5_EUMVA|nr:hypothetical protein EVAR_2749_1 [Eumeta japonica]